MLNNKRRIAIIDIDGVLFATACSSERQLGDNEGGQVFLQMETPEKAYSRVLDRIEELLLKTDCEDAILCLTHRENFRFAVLPFYKSNRVASRRPPMLATLRDMLQERKPFPVLLIENLEADDVCGITYGTLTEQGRECVIVSPDKDLKTIPGFYYACRTDSRVVEISQAEADYNHLFQTLTGDIVDGYAGCPKVGKVGAMKLLQPFTENDEADGPYIDLKGAWQAVVAAFEKKGLTKDDALVQARVARILRASDWDVVKREVILWEPPE